MYIYDYNNATYMSALEERKKREGEGKEEEAKHVVVVDTRSIKPSTYRGKTRIGEQAEKTEK